MFPKNFKGFSSRLDRIDRPDLPPLPYTAAIKRVRLTAPAGTRGSIVELRNSALGDQFGRTLPTWNGI